ncbi:MULTISPECIES: signal peptidase I [Sphingobacterium]|uniref:Signal peptidase I n=1 Tax=Sphingobacterium populi TaxID=1812824 RepID=A0ABW5UDF9_9SPHI|nr:signal peptidase I [Sphingobacterium sp. CFCC 11742]
MIYYILFGLFQIVSWYGLFLLFRKAGKQGWEAFVPFYREVIFADLVARPRWWVLWLLVPIVNVFVFFGLYFDLLKSFGKRRFWETAAAVLVPFIVLPMWGNDATVKYLGPSNTEEFKKKYPYKKSAVREWTDAIIFATVAASLIRSFLIEPYVIPTGSMERSLLIGDFLFVSKLNYGARIPMTPLAFPFAHHTMPITGGKAYSEWIKLPYKRLPGFQEIKRNDVVVFNYPMDADAPFERPVDKRENYIKRCVGMPGDVLTMKGAQLFVNGEVGYESENLQPSFIVVTEQPYGLDLNRLVDKRYELSTYLNDPSRGVYVLHITREEAEEVRQWSNVKEVIEQVYGPDDNSEMAQAFPFYKDGTVWNYDNFGPFTIPKKGWTVKLDNKTLPLYRRAITVYEGNTLEERADGLYLNGKLADSYTFNMDYYWMMGDNRHNSLDSRGWGFVPEDHIVGKAVLTFMSYDEDGSFLSKIRWNRIFRGIN